MTDEELQKMVRDNFDRDHADLREYLHKIACRLREHGIDKPNSVRYISDVAVYSAAVYLFSAVSSDGGDFDCGIRSIERVMEHWHREVDVAIGVMLDVSAN